MSKFWKRSLCVIAVIVFCSCVCSGCSLDRTLKKQAKKLNTYTMDINIDQSDMTAECYLRYEYTNRTDSVVDSFVFHLYPRAFREGATVKPYTSVSEARCFPNGISYGDIKINEVRLDDKNHDYFLIGEDEDKLEVKLNSELFYDDHAEIEIYFDLTIPNSTHRFGYYQNNINLANFYPQLSVLENGEYDLTPYYANGDPFYSECANYVVSVTAPSEYDVFSSGDVIKTENSDGKTKTTFSALAVRDFAIVLGNNFEVASVALKGQTINYVGYKGDNDLFSNVELAKKAFEYFSEQFRAYPYKTLNVIKTPFVHGGMEYPGLVMISDTCETSEEKHKVIVHEVAHEWWYALVGVNETKDAWIDEGLAEFSSALFFGATPEYNITYNQMVNDAITSYTLYVDVISSLNRSVNTKMNLKVNEYVNEYEYTYMIYIKGLILFDDLMQVTGKNKLIGALSHIARDYAFSNIDTDIFTESIKKLTRKNTDSFFESYLNGNAIIGKLH